MGILDETFYTAPELAGLLRISTGTVYSRLKEWPHTRITPSDVRFTEQNIRDIINLSTRTPAPTDTKRTPLVGTRANKPRRNK